MMKQNQWQILFFIMIFMTIYVLFSPEMYNSILGRTVVVFTIILLAKYNIMLGLGLVLVAIYMYPDANYMSYTEGMTDATAPTSTSLTSTTPTSTAPTSTAPTSTAPTSTTPAVAAQKKDDKEKVTTVQATPTAVALPKATDLQSALTDKIATIAEGMAKLRIKSTKKEGFTENKKYSGTTDRIAKEERMRPRSSVTPQLYQGRGHGVSTSGYQEPSPNSDLNSLGFAFLS